MNHFVILITQTALVEVTAIHAQPPLFRANPAPGALGLIVVAPFRSIDITFWVLPMRLKRNREGRRSKILTIHFMSASGKLDGHAGFRINPKCVPLINRHRSVILAKAFFYSAENGHTWDVSLHFESRRVLLSRPVHTRCHGHPYYLATSTVIATRT